MFDRRRMTLLRTTALIGLFIFIAVASGVVPKPHQKGRYIAQFTEYSPLSSSSAISKRMHKPVEPGRFNDHIYKIERETFEVYVPDTYDPNTPFGLLVWVSPSPSGAIEQYSGYRELVDKYKLIWVGANNSGNTVHYDTRRVPLALDAEYNMQKLYSIDPDRVYVAGLSGGGRVSSITAFHYSEIFDGGIFVIGCNYWLQMAVPGKVNTYWKSGFTRPAQENLVRAKNNGRYVLLTGDNDGNRLQMHTYYKEGYSKWLDHVLYIQVPDMGHKLPPPAEFEKALKFLDAPLKEKALTD